MSKSYDTTPTHAHTSVAARTSLSTQKTPSWFIPLEENKEDCEACGKTRQLEDNLTCSKCKKYFHFSCTELPNYELVKYYKTNLYKRKYICPICINNLHPRDLHNITQNRLQKKDEDKCEEEEESNIKNLTIELHDREEEIFLAKKKMDEAKRENEYLRKCNEKLKEELIKNDNKITELVKELDAIQQRATTQEACLEQELKNTRQRQELQREEVSEELRKAVRSETSTIIDSLHAMNERLERLEKMTEEPEGEEVNQPEEETEQPNRPQQRQPTNIPARRPPPNCYNCGKLGHLARQCYFRQRPFYRSRPYRPNDYQYRRNQHMYSNRRQNYVYSNRQSFREEFPRDEMERYRTTQNNSNGELKVYPTQPYKNQSHPQHYQQYRQPSPKQALPYPPLQTHDVYYPRYPPTAQYMPYSATYQSIPPTNF